MKHIKKYEALYETNLKIGDYVKTNDSYHVDLNETTSIWHNQYGIIKNIGYRIKTHELYLVHYDYDINDEMKDFIDRSTKDYNFYELETNYEQKKYDEWFCDEYLIKISKEEFDEAIAQIKIKLSADKYNL